MFIKYCVFFFKNSKKFATSPSPALGCYWLYKNDQPIGETVHSHCVESFEGLLQRCRRGRGCSELCKNTIFPSLTQILASALVRHTFYNIRLNLTTRLYLCYLSLIEYLCLVLSLYAFCLVCGQKYLPSNQS